MIIKIVNVLFQVEVEQGTPEAERQALDNLLEEFEEATSSLYDGANVLVEEMLQKAKRFGLELNSKFTRPTPKHDFDLHVEIAVVTHKRK